MNDGRGGRFLPVLAAFLLLLALAVSLALIFIRVPDRQKFDDAYLSAVYSADAGRTAALKSDLLWASRHAVSVDHWTRLLALSYRTIPSEAQDSDYRFFSVMAGRAASAVPGNGDFLALWTWGLLRQGQLSKARRNLVGISESHWSGLRAELRLKDAAGSEAEDLAAFSRRLSDPRDPEFLRSAAALTESAELTFDAALLLARQGQTDESYELMREIAEGRRFWRDPDILRRRGLEVAMASVAYDAGRSDEAIRWLESRVRDTERRRTASWENLQFLGDLYWNRYLAQGNPADRRRAAEAWSAAVEVVRSGGEAADAGDSWRLWVNLAALEEEAGRVRDAEQRLNDALTAFPAQPEVRAAWARAVMDTDPAMARRVMDVSGSLADSPVMGITALQVDPESVSPRLYESRLWELFESASAEGTLSSVEGRLIATYLLDYMTVRRNFDSLDVAVDRYRKAHPGEAWILSWRLASDAVRGIGAIDLVAPSISSVSPYDEFRSAAIAEGNWRALHDSAVFAMLTSRELRRAAAVYPGGGNRPDDDFIAGILLTTAESEAYSVGRSGSPLGDRLDTLRANRPELVEAVVHLGARGRRGHTAAQKAGSALTEVSRRLADQARDDLDRALGIDSSMTGEDRARLLYLDALLLLQDGDGEAALERAADAVEADPNDIRARELLNNEVIP